MLRILSNHDEEIDKLLEAQENATYQVTTGFTLESDWLREWRKFSGSMTQRGRATPQRKLLYKLP